MKSHLSLPPLADEKILSLRVTAEIANLSLPTLRRRISDGTGPVITRPSPRRVGVRVRHLRSWLDSCAEKLRIRSASLRSAANTAVAIAEEQDSSAPLPPAAHVDE